MKKRKQGKKDGEKARKDKNIKYAHSPVVVDVMTERKQGSVTELESMALTALL